ncbi:MAG: hypothetical protein AAFO07_14375 [Bacteroidota bacterium]
MDDYGKETTIDVYPEIADNALRAEIIGEPADKVVVLNILGGSKPYYIKLSAQNFRSINSTVLETNENRLEIPLKVEADLLGQFDVFCLLINDASKQEFDLNYCLEFKKSNLGFFLLTAAIVFLLVIVLFLGIRLQRRYVKRRDISEMEDYY